MPKDAEQKVVRRRVGAVVPVKQKTVVEEQQVSELEYPELPRELPLVGELRYYEYSLLGAEQDGPGSEDCCLFHVISPALQAILDQ